MTLEDRGLAGAGEAGRWRRRDAVLWRVVLDDAVILVPDESEPFALTGGASLWRLLEQPRTTAELISMLSGSQGAARSRAEGELDSLLSELAAQGALERLPA